jgi:hypothetical protein
MIQPVTAVSACNYWVAVICQIVFDAPSSIGSATDLMGLEWACDLSESGHPIQELRWFGSRRRPHALSGFRTAAHARKRSEPDGILSRLASENPSIGDVLEGWT